MDIFAALENMKHTNDPIQQMHVFRTFLRRYSLKATPQRVAVQQAMMALVHAPADKVLRWIAENTDVKLTPASVYNTLSQFSALGLYGCRLSADSKMHFDIVPTPHVHLYDSVNHEFKDLPDEKLYSDIVSRIGQRRFKGYSVDGVDVCLMAHPTKTRGLFKKK